MMVFVLVFSVFGLVADGPASGAPPATPYPARVSDNHRYLIDQYGEPFFYLGDTAWELFHRLTREEADLYLRNRAAKRFTVIQAVILAEFAGLVEPNKYGAVAAGEQRSDQAGRGVFQKHRLDCRPGKRSWVW